jgi:hypothetical protein
LKQRLIALIPFALAIVAPGLLGCVDPGKRFDDFNERVIDAGPAGPSCEGALQDINGEFLVTLAPGFFPDRLLQFIATVELTIEPRNARLSVDGETIPPNGPVRSVRLDPGRRTIEVSAEGFGPLRETIALEPGSRLSRTIELQKIEAPPPPPVLAEAGPDPVAPPPPPSLTPTSVESEPKDESSILTSPWLWVVVGVVVVGAAVGITVGVTQRGTEEPFGGTTGDVLEP